MPAARKTAPSSGHVDFHPLKVPGSARSAAERSAVSTSAPTLIATSVPPKTAACSHTGSMFTPEGAGPVIAMRTAAALASVGRRAPNTAARIVRRGSPFRPQQWPRRRLGPDRSRRCCNRRS